MNRIHEIKPVSVKNIPWKDEMGHGKVYVSEEYGTAAFLCPCGCGEEIAIAIKSPVWEGVNNAHIWGYKLTDDTLTLSPSILQRVGCKSHFFIRGNKVIWC